MHFSDYLDEQIQVKGAPVCVGYDPRPERMPESVAQKSEVIDAIVQFGKEVVDAIQDSIPVIKLQCAFFIKYGSKGVAAMEELLKYAKDAGLIVILDAKTNDIGSTSEAYASGFLSSETDMGCSIDALTVNPYLGADSIEPFIKEANADEKGLFVLVKTSNPGSGDIQDLKVGSDSISMRVGDLVHRLGTNNVGENGLSNIGAVVGATYPEIAAELRVRMPEAWFLVPGFGAQGATEEDVIPNFLPNKKGALIVSARNINYAHSLPEYKDLAYKDAIRQSAKDMCAKVNGVLEKI